MAALTIELPWPVAELSPNKRIHYRPLAAFKKKAREDAYWATRQAMGAQWGPTVTSLEHDGLSDILIGQVAHPPANYRYDRDGIDARLKAARDGIADALKIDDRFFRPTGIEWGSPVAGGKVVISIGGQA